MGLDVLARAVSLVSTPLIAHWPNGIAKSENGGLRHAPGYLPDIMATIVEASEATYPQTFEGAGVDPIEGQSLLSVFANDRDAIAHRKPMFWEHEGNAAVRIGKWKLVKRYPHDWELYYMDVDRTELHDLAAKEPQRVVEMATRYGAWAERCGGDSTGKGRGADEQSGVTRAF